MDLKDDTKGTNSSEADAKAESRAPSIRESIMAAVEEHSEETGKQVSAKEDKEDSKSEVKDAKVDEKEPAKPESEDKALEAVDKQEQKDKSVKEEKAPTFLPKEIQQDWDKIPVNVRAYVAKSQKELADYKAETGRKLAASKELDDAVAPYMGSIQQLGITPGQTVDRLFQWMNALSGPNKYDAIFELAKNFNIDLDSVYAGAVNNQGGQQQQQYQDNQGQQQQYQDIDPRLADAIYGMYQEINSMKEGQQRQKQQSAASLVNNWAGLQPDGTFSKKPYFNQVRQSMLGLLSSGSIPLANGQLDLDTAYEQACYSNPEIRQELMAKQAEEKAAQAARAAKDKAAEDAAKAAKAAKLNVSLRPTSPTGNLNNSRKANSGNKSIRESLYDAIREVNN